LSSQTRRLKASPAKTELPPSEEAILPRGVREVFKKAMRGPARTWKLYKDSKTGLAGFGIVLTFFILAAFAPIIAPYSTNFRAPAVDVFVADSVDVPLGRNLSWSAPIGLLDNSRELPLQRILLPSKDGTALTFSVNVGLQKIEIGNPVTNPIPLNASYINYMHFPRTVSEQTFFLILAGQTLYEYTSNVIDANTEYALPFVPKFQSNVWNGYSTTLKDARMAIAYADDHSVWLMDKRPKSPYDPFVRTFESNLSIPDATIVGNPLVIDSDYFENGSMLIVPTNSDLKAYRLDVTKTLLTGVTTNVKIGELMWRKNYSIGGVPFEPVDSKDLITFPYPVGASDSFGKTNILLATKDGHIVSYQRETGEITYDHPLIIPSIRDETISALYPSPQGVILTAKTGPRGVIACIDPTIGVVRYNQSMWALAEGYINSQPSYVEGLKSFIYSSDKGIIYLTNELLKTNVTFAAPSGGAQTPVSFLGNIYIFTSVTGNYFSVITKDNTMFVETLSGVNMAPLPPGKYASGNTYWLGTDYEGHDILSWFIYGTRQELEVGIVAAFFAVVIGTIVGLVAGFYPGIIDDVLMRATDVVLSLPYLVILLLFAAVFGPSLVNVIIIIGILSWAGIARVIRSVTLSLKQRAFVDAAIVAGASESRLIFKHIAPNVLPYTFLYMTFTISGAIVTEAILAFLGFGDVNSVTWGMMLQYLQISGHSLSAPWWLLPPGIGITLLSLSFYLIGRAFDEVVNPRLRKR
jgi:peptide/nickel transport system permease protein